MINGDAAPEVESIKRLKARYCRYLDAKDWESWRALFADNFVSDLAEVGGRVIVGADEFVDYTRKTIGKPTQATVHQVQAPEIELTSTTTAHGVWALHDVVRLVPALTLYGYGHYHENYEKIDGHWLITFSKLTRLREDIDIRLVPPRLAKWLRIAAAKVARRTSTAKHLDEKGKIMP
jgi:SnoaL-like protein